MGEQRTVGTSASNLRTLSAASEEGEEGDWASSAQIPATTGNMLPAVNRPRPGAVARVSYLTIIHHAKLSCSLRFPTLSYTSAYLTFIALNLFLLLGSPGQDCNFSLLASDHGNPAGAKCNSVPAGRALPLPLLAVGPARRGRSPSCVVAV